MLRRDDLVVDENANPCQARMRELGRFGENAVSKLTSNRWGRMFFGNQIAIIDAPQQLVTMKMYSGIFVA